MPQPPVGRPCTYEIIRLDSVKKKKIKDSQQRDLSFNFFFFMTFLEPFGECRKIDMFMKPSRWPHFAPTQVVFFSFLAMKD